MSERVPNTERSFDHPYVQSLLAANSRKVYNSHLHRGYIGSLAGSLHRWILRDMVGDKPDSGTRVNQLWNSLQEEGRSFVPFAVCSRLREYEGIEQTLQLVKVNQHGSIVPNSEVEVAILDYKTKATLTMQPTFSHADIKLVLDILDNQEKVGWQPNYPEGDPLRYTYGEARNWNGEVVLSPQ